MYLSRATLNSRIITIEGSESVAAIADANLKRLNMSNVDIIHGNFSQELPKALNGFGTVDLAFIDGDHRGRHLLDYFHQIFPSMSENGAIVLDDIRWSEDMYDAWNQIVDHPDVMLTLDLFGLGVVFHVEGYEKQHFKLRPFF